jgi:murein DD-endopeptidase MepM/ murein hydrolase activator NlpD
MRALLATLVILLVPAASASAEVQPGSGSWPLRPRPEVVRPFEAPSSAWGPGHRGADLLGHADQPVRAAQSGTVSFVGHVAGVGSVSVDHGGTRTTYQPVLPSVHRGDPVAEGAVIGHLAVAGGHCLPRVCLHWGLIQGRSTYLDPLVLVGAAASPVRLLPLGGSVLSPALPVDPAGRWAGPAPTPAAVGGSEALPRLL